MNEYDDLFSLSKKHLTLENLFDFVNYRIALLERIQEYTEKQTPCFFARLQELKIIRGCLIETSGIISYGKTGEGK